MFGSGLIVGGRGHCVESIVIVYLLARYSHAVFCWQLQNALFTRFVCFVDILCSPSIICKNVGFIKKVGQFFVNLCGMHLCRTGEGDNHNFDILRDTFAVEPVILPDPAFKLIAFSCILGDLLCDRNAQPGSSYSAHVVGIMRIEIVRS